MNGVSRGGITEKVNLGQDLKKGGNSYADNGGGAAFQVEQTTARIKTLLLLWLEWRE